MSELTGTFTGLVTIPVTFTVNNAAHFEDEVYKAARRWLEDNYIDVAHLQRINDEEY